MVYVIPPLRPPHTVQAMGLNMLDEYLEEEFEDYLARKVLYLKYSASCSSTQQLLDVSPMFRTFKRCLKAALAALTARKGEAKAKEVTPITVSA